MIEDTVDEELLDEFKGLKLSINPSTDKLIKRESVDKEPIVVENNNWGSKLITPFTSIPNKLTLWSKNADSAQKTDTIKATKENTLQQTVCITENPNNFFTFREHILAKALAECEEQFLDEEADGPLLEAFLLTQISHWNSDKERLLLVTPHTLVVVKYDFIALKRLGYKKLPLDAIDDIIVGDLVYPNGSLIPHMNGLVDGVSNVLETCLFARWSKKDNKQLNTSFYQPRNRNMKGIRLTWNKNKPFNLGSQWNPFNENIPFFTFTFHPLYFHKDCVDDKLKNLYNLEAFIEKLCKSIADLPRNNDINNVPCTIQEKDIILQSYVGLGSVIHNRNALGFFKVRGKFSF